LKKQKKTESGFDNDWANVTIAVVIIAAAATACRQTGISIPKEKKSEKGTLPVQIKKEKRQRKEFSVIYE